MVMDYFIEGTFNRDNSVIEKAALARLEIFHSLGRDCRAVLMDYSPEWVAAVPDELRSQVTGIFDYWQTAPGNRLAPIGLRQLDGQLGFYNREVNHDDPRVYDYTDGDRVIARAALAPDNQVDTVTFLDAAERVIEVDQYDQRGFLSRRQYWYSGHVTHEEYLSPTGEIIIEIMYSDRGEVELIRLTTQCKTYTDLAEWQQAYLKTLTDADWVICDRRRFDSQVADMHACRRFLRVYRQLPASIFENVTVLTTQLATELAGTVALDEYHGKQKALANWQEYLGGHK